MTFFGFGGSAAGLEGGLFLPELLLVALCGTLAGAKNVVEIEDWGTRKLGFLRRLLPFGRGIPFA